MALSFAAKGKFFCVKTKNDNSVLFPFFFAFVMRRGDSMIDI